MKYNDIAHNSGILVSGIYSITNLVNGKMYIGLTVDMYDRWRTHARNAGKKNRPLYNAIEKHGIDNFDFQILQECHDREALAALEIEYIAKYNTTIPNGYNLTIGGEGVVPATEEQRQASSDKMKAAWQDEDYRTSQMASLNTESHKQRQGEDTRVRWQDPDYREKMKLAMSEAMNREGYKEKLSAAQKLLWSTDSHKAKMKACRPIESAESRAIKATFMKDIWSDQSYKETTSIKIKEALNRPEVKAAQVAALKDKWKDPEFLIKMCFRRFSYGGIPTFIQGLQRAEAKGVDTLIWHDWALDYYNTKYPSLVPELTLTDA